MPKPEKLDIIVEATRKRARLVQGITAENLVFIAEATLSNCVGAFQQAFADPENTIKESMLSQLSVEDILQYAVPLAKELAVDDADKLRERMCRLSFRYDAVIRNLAQTKAFITALNGRVQRDEEKIPRPRSSSI